MPSSHFGHFELTWIIFLNLLHEILTIRVKTIMADPLQRTLYISDHGNKPAYRASL